MKEMNPKAPRLLLAAMTVVLIVAACTPATATIPAATPQVIQQTVVVAVTQATVDYWQPEEITAACGVEKCMLAVSQPME